MSTVNTLTIPINVLSNTRDKNLGHRIVSGDSDAYIIVITWTDIATISGTVQLYFVLGDGTYATRDASDGVVLADNTVTYTLEEALYSVAGNLTCYVQFINSNLYTPLKLTFSGIHIPTGTTEVDSAVAYPAWAAAMVEIGAYSALTAYAVGNRVTYSGSSYECIVATTAGTLPTDTDYWILIASKGDDNVLSVGTVTTLAAGADATAEITGSSPTQVLNLGLPQGDAGTINTSTNTDITGVIAGDGTNIKAATAAELPVADAGGYITGDKNTENAIQEYGAQLSAIDADVDALFEYAEQSALVHYIIWDTALSQCTRGGVDAEITTTTTHFGHFGSVDADYANPFDNIYPWRDRKLCNVDITTYQSIYAAGGALLDCVVAWEGDVDFELDGSNGFVGVYTPEFWGLVKLLKDGTKWFIGISSVPITGWTHYEETIGGRWFGVADGAGITSKPGLAVVNETMAAIHARATAYDMTLDDIYTWSADTMLMAIEYATLNSQTAIGNGADEVYVLSIRPYIDESAVNRVVMTDAQSANFRTGVMIDIGTSDGNHEVARRIVTSVEDYGPDSAYAIVNFDGAAVNIVTTQYVSAHGTSNVLDSDILSTSGYIGTISKCNAYYRGRVAHANYWRYVLGAYRQTGDGGIWIANSRDEAAAVDALNTGAHTDTGFVLPETSEYIASLHMLASGMYPFAKTTGGSGGSANPVGDFTYVPSLATGNTVLLVGGSAASGVDCGRFYGRWDVSAANSYWNLSCLPFLKTP
jgi:hypothetical protein